MNDNQVKTINGKINKGNLLTELKILQQEGNIVYCSSDYRLGYDDYSKNQFFAPFYIEYTNGESWILFPTNSIRSDRANIQQWNSFHLKTINNKIIKSFLIIPDEIIDNQKEYETAKSYNKNIKTKRIFSSIDGVYTISEIIEQIKIHR